MNVLSIFFYFSDDADTVKRLFGIDLVSRCTKFLMLFSIGKFWCLMCFGAAEVFALVFK